MKKPGIGDVFEIQDDDQNCFYYAAVGLGYDVCLFDIASTKTIKSVDELKDVPILARLAVAQRSIWSFKNKVVGKIVRDSICNQYGRYVYRMTPDRVYTMSGKNGSLVEATEDKVIGLEPTAVYDLEFHVIPSLQSHYFGIEHSAHLLADFALNSKCE